MLLGADHEILIHDGEAGGFFFLILVYLPDNTC